MQWILIALTILGLASRNTYAEKIRYIAEGVDLSSAVLGGEDSIFRIIYTVENLSFAANQELDLQFDPSMYVHLSDGVAPVGFEVLLLQPDNPRGTRGDFSVTAVVGFRGYSGEFSVDVQMAGNSRPGTQDFVISQLDEDGVLTFQDFIGADSGDHGAGACNNAGSMHGIARRMHSDGRSIPS